MKTIKELEVKAKKWLKDYGPYDSGYSNILAKIHARRDVLGLIDERLGINDQLYKDKFITRDQHISANGVLQELKARIEGK